MIRIIYAFINWEDKFYFPFIKEHYGKFCEKIILFDNYSHDGSKELAAELGFEVRNFGYPGQLNDQSYLDMKNNWWREFRGLGIDYVITADADEFLVPDDLRGSAPVVHGFNMISETLPDKSIWEINMGAPSENYSKQVIFSPDRIQEINFVHGCHKNHMVGDISREGSCRLLHLRQIGGIDRMLERHRRYRPRLSKFNLTHKMGHHYGRPEWKPEEILAFENEKRKEWETLKAEATPLW